MLNKQCEKTLSSLESMLMKADIPESLQDYFKLMTIPLEEKANKLAKKLDSLFRNKLKESKLLRIKQH